MSAAYRLHTSAGAIEIAYEAADGLSGWGTLRWSGSEAAIAQVQRSLRYVRGIFGHIAMDPITEADFRYRMQAVDLSPFRPERLS